MGVARLIPQHEWSLHRLTNRECGTLKTKGGSTALPAVLDSFHHFVFFLLVDTLVAAPHHGTHPLLVQTLIKLQFPEGSKSGQ